MPDDTLGFVFCPCDQELVKLRPKLEVSFPASRRTIDVLAVKTIAEVKADHPQHRRLDAKTEAQRAPEV